jgi:hypothetical protein
MKSCLNKNFTDIKSRPKKKNKSKKAKTVTYQKPTRIWSDEQGCYVDMTEADLDKYKQHLKVKASTRGESIKVKWSEK